MACSGTMNPPAFASSARCSSVRGSTTTCSPCRRCRTCGEDRRVKAVVQRDRRRRADDGDRPGAIEAELGEHGGVGLEVRQVVLLLEPFVAAQLVERRAVRRQALGRDRVRDDDAGRQPAVDVVLLARPLVVEGRDGRDPQQLRGDRDVVGAVAEREVDPPPARPARERARARDEPDPLGGEPAAPVMADRGVVDPEALEQPERLREVARGDEHLVAAAPERVDHGSHDEHVRRVREVDPDAQGRAGYPQVFLRGCVRAAMRKILIAGLAIAASLAGASNASGPVGAGRLRHRPSGRHDVHRRCPVHVELRLHRRRRRRVHRPGRALLGHRRPDRHRRLPDAEPPERDSRSRSPAPRSPGRWSTTRGRRCSRPARPTPTRAPTTTSR